MNLYRIERCSEAAVRPRDHAGIGKLVIIHSGPGRSETVYQFSAALQNQSSGVGESHPHALSEPYVNVSAHTAPIIQPKDKHHTASVQIASARVELIDEAIWWLCADAYTSCISFVPILSAGHLRP